MPKITKRLVESSPIKERDYFIWDDEVKGFAIRILPSGTRMYQIQYRKGGRTRRASIGRHGILTADHTQGAKEVSDINDRHYTTVLASGNEKLCQHIERNFTSYLCNVLLKLEENTHEEIETIRQVLEHVDVPKEHLEEFLYIQDIVFPSLEQIPHEFHSSLFEKLMVEATWENLISYSNIETFDAAVLAKYMQSSEQKSSLLQDSYGRDDRSLPMSRFIFNNEVFSDEEYRQYVQKLPVRFKNFPETVPASRRIILIEEDIIRLTDGVFETAKVDEGVVVCLLVYNIDEFLKDRSKYPIDDVVRERLLTSNISDDKKLSIIEDVDLILVPENAAMAETIGAVFNRVDIDLKSYETDLLLAVLRHAKPLSVRVSLLNKCHELLTYDQICQAIKEMPEPFPDFLSVGWGTPRVPDTPDNNSLVAWLEQREIISSSRVTYLGEIKFNTFRKPRSQEG
jgi:hypothetical protein